MIRRLLCKLGFHQFGLFVVEEVAAGVPGPIIEIARRQCLHCPRHYYDDPDLLPSSLIQSRLPTRWCRYPLFYNGLCLRCAQPHETQLPEGKNVDLPQPIIDAAAEHHARAFDGMFNSDIPKPPKCAMCNDALPGFFCPGEDRYDYEIKSWPAFFSKMITGEKKHDMRDKSERDYRAGDRILLREYDPFGGGYTGRSAIFKITYITSNDTPCAMSSNALARDACILSVELLETFL